MGARFVGALRAAGRAREANELKEILQAGGYHLIETDPFETPPIVVAPAIKRSPYVIRIHTMWASMQKTAIGAFDAPPGAPASTSASRADRTDSCAHAREGRITHSLRYFPRVV